MHGKSGFESKVRILDLAVEREMQNGFHPHPSPHPPPRNPSPNHDFMGVLYTVLVGKAKETCKTVLVNSVFFFLFVIRARTVQLFCQKQFKPFLVSPPPPPPALKKKKKRKEERKTKDRLIWVEIRFQISRRSIRISKIQVQISQSNTPALLSFEVSGELPR